MARVCAIERAIQAWSLDVVVESLFIDPLVNIGSTLGAFEVSFGFLKMVLAWSWGRVDLGLEEVPDDLNSGQLFCWLGSLLPWVWTCTFCQLLGAGFSQAVFKLLGRETLVHACAAGGAGISTPLRCPSVVWFLPGLGALLDEVFFPLFGVFSRLPVCFGVEVVLFVLENLLKSLCCLEVDGLVVSVRCCLPVCLATVMQSISPLPCSQGCISLSPAELWLISRGIRSSGILADVQDGDAVAVLV